MPLIYSSYLNETLNWSDVEYSLGKKWLKWEEVDLKWENGILEDLTLIPSISGKCELSYQGKRISFDAQKDKLYHFNHQLQQN